MTAAAAVSALPQFTTRRVFATRALRDVCADGTLAAAGIVQQLCKSLDVDHAAMRGWDEIAVTPVRLRKGATLFRAGDRVTSLHVIRAGSCKTVLLHDDGGEQVADYHMAGDIIGLDGLGADRYGCCAIALEDSDVCAIPLQRIRALADEGAGFQYTLHRMLAREIARSRRLVAMLAKMSAEQRLASFLLDLAQRYQARGYSPTEFVLRTTRDEIGSYLGLKLETVSRVFSRFHQLGMIQVQGRVIKLLDRGALQHLIDTGAQ